jgi:flagellar biosynthetic protein FliS
MFASSPSSSLNAYRQNAAHGGVAAADPHQLVTMLYDGAIERIQRARGAMAAGERRSAAELISRSVDIVEELRSALAPSKLHMNNLRGMRYLPVMHKASWCKDTKVNYIATFTRTAH